MSDYMKIFQSASKIVLIAMTFALVLFTGLKIVPPEYFKDSLLMVFTFYFAHKPAPDPIDGTTTTTAAINK